jgi:anti-anti-sigma regulatory factor
VLDLEGVDFIDSQGAAKLHEILELADQANATLRIARLKPTVREVLMRDGLVAALGEDRIHGNVHQAVEAQISANGRAAFDGSDDPRELR